MSSVEDRMKQLQKLQTALRQQSDVLTLIKADLDGEPADMDMDTRTQPMARVA